MLTVEVADICVVADKVRSIAFRCHISAASPVFVAYAEVIYNPRLFSAVCFSHFRHWRNAVKRHIFDPFAHFLHRTGAEVAVYISIAPKLTAKLKILVCAERIIFNNSAPVGVDHFFAHFFRADTVFPMVFVGKASARPAKNGNTHLFKRVNNVTAHTVYIRNVGILTYKKTFINTSAEMLAEMAVDILVDFTDFLMRIDKIMFHIFPYLSERNVYTVSVVKSLYQIFN